MKEFKSYDIDEIKTLIQSVLPLSRKINYIHIHHTAEPTKANYQGLRSIQGIYNYHTETRGWSDVGYHFIIDTFGEIWAGRDLNKDPASILNHNANAIAIAMIGNFDIEILKGPQKKAVVELTKHLISTFHLSAAERIIFHKEKADTSCPGKNIKKQEFLNWIHEQPKTEFVHIRPVEVVRKGNTYKGYILPDGKSYVEVRQLLQDLGLKVDWENEQVVLKPPETAEEKLNMIRIIVE